MSFVLGPGENCTTNQLTNCGPQIDFSPSVILENCENLFHVPSRFSQETTLVETKRTMFDGVSVPSAQAVKVILSKRKLQSKAR